MEPPRKKHGSRNPAPFLGEKDTHEFVAYFQKELEGKDVRIHSLNELMAHQDAERQAEHDALVRRQSEQVADLETKLQTADTTSTAKIQMLEDELAKVDTFREMKRAMDAKIEEQETALKLAEERHLAEATANERKFLAEKSKMQKDLEKRTSDIRRAAKQEMQNGLDADTLKVIGENRRMAEELRFQQQMTAELQSEKNAVDEAVRVLRRDMELAREKEGEYAKQSHVKNREAKKREEKIAALEELLRDAGKKFQGEKAHLRRSLQASLEEQTLDAAGLRQMLRLKNRELSKLRRLAEMVLEQRTEVEQFFLEALEDVKANIVKQRQERYRADMAEYRTQMRTATLGDGTAKFPKIRALQAGKDVDGMGPPAPGTMPHNLSAKVQLKDLTLEDREHVLRLLFAKINAVHGNVSSLPPHDLENNERTFLTNSAPTGGGDGGM